MKATSYQLRNPSGVREPSTRLDGRAREPAVEWLAANVERVVREAAWSALSSETRDALRVGLPLLLIADGLERDQALVARLIAAAGGAMTHAALKSRLEAAGLSKVRRHRAIRRLIAAGRLEAVIPDGGAAVGGQVPEKTRYGGST